MAKIREILVYFDHFWTLCDGRYCSVGLSWGIWIEPSLSNTSMLLVWPKNHFGVVYPKKMMKIWTISVYFDHFWSLCDGQHCSVGLLWEIWIEPSLPNTPMLSVWPEKMMKIWTTSVYLFLSFLKSMRRATLSARLLWEIWIEPSLPNTMNFLFNVANHLR